MPAPFKTAASYVQGARTPGREYYTSGELFAREMERRASTSCSEWEARA
jgi:hypothetical protein